MLKNQRNPNGVMPYAGILPLLTETIADMIVGLITLLLFSPIGYGIFKILEGTGEVNEGLYVLIFWDSWKQLLTTPEVNWIVAVVGIIFISLLIGLLMRHPFWLVMTIIVKLCQLQKLFALPAFKTLNWEHGGNKWTQAVNWKIVKYHFVDRLPFWQIGDKDYARFRCELMKSGSKLSEGRLYWEHEEFLFFLHYRAFSIIVTFIAAYLLYASVVAWYLKNFWPPYVPFLLALVLAIFVAFSLYRGMIFHGCAFVAIDDVLQREFKQATGR